MLVLIDGLQAGNRSGTGAYTAALARWLPEAAPDLTVRVLWPEHADAPDGCGESVLVRYGHPRLAGRLLARQFGVQRLARRLGAGLVHYPATVGRLLPSEIPMVVTVHDLSFYHNRHWFRAERAWYYRLATALSARRAVRVLADSEATARDIVGFLRVPRDRVDVVHLAPNENMARQAPAHQADAVRARYHLPERFFLYLGTLEPRKNLIRLIQAYDMIGERCPLDLVLAGRDGWKEKGIHAAAHSARCASRIHLPGFIAAGDVPALYRAAEAFVYPSLLEGFGLPVADALAAGLPVITSDCSALPEVTGDAALLVNPENTASLATALERLAVDAALRAEMASRGRMRAARFSWLRVAGETAAAYRQALSESILPK